MSQAARIRRNTLFVLLSQIVRLLTNVVLFMGIARLYGPSEFGQFTAAHTLAIIFILLADFGFDVLLSSEIARHRERAAALSQMYLSVKLVLAIVASLAMALTASVQSVSSATKLLMYVFSMYVLFSALLNFFFALFKGFEEMHHETRISLVINSLLLVAVVALGLSHVPIGVLAVAFVGSRILGLVLALIVAARKVPLRTFGFSFALKPDILLIGVFGLHALFGNLFFIQDTVLLSWWAGDHAVGIYQSVFKIVSLALVLLDVSFATLLPVLSRMHGEDNARWHSLGHLLHKTLIFTGLPIALIMIVYAEQIIGLIYPDSFNEAIPLLRVFGWTVMIRYAADASATMLTSARRQGARLVVVAVAVVLNYVLNVYAIPRFGTMGACVVSLATNMLVAVGYVTAAWKDVRNWLYDLHNYIPAVAAVLVGVALWQYRGFPLWLAGPSVVVLLGVVSYGLGYTRSERALLFSLKKVTYVPDESASRGV